MQGNRNRADAEFAENRAFQRCSFSKFHAVRCDPASPRRFVPWALTLCNNCLTSLSRATFVLTFLLNGGLNHDVFLCLLRLV